jgi:hypothetical protein
MDAKHAVENAVIEKAEMQAELLRVSSQLVTMQQQLAA